MTNKEIELVQEKSKLKLEVNLWLMGTAFTLFTFIITINPDLIRNNDFLSLQLTLAIPLLFSSIFARGRLTCGKEVVLWNNYGFITFIIAYGFLVNAIGILLSTLVSINIGLIFWLVNILSAFLYSLLEIKEDKAKISTRLWRDGIFILIVVLGGLLPILGIY
jgi:hypothetical protein